MKWQDYIIPSTRIHKKYMVRVNGKLIHFGDNRYQDYTTHHDKTRRDRYHSRHQHDDFYDTTKPSFWSMFFLWQYLDKQDAFNNIIKTFNPSLTRW